MGSPTGKSSVPPTLRALSPRAGAPVRSTRKLEPRAAERYDVAVRYEDFDAYLRWRGTTERPLPKFEPWARGWGDRWVHFERRGDEVLLWRYRLGMPSRDVLVLRTERADDGTTIVRHGGYRLRHSQKRAALLMPFCTAIGGLIGGGGAIWIAIFFGTLLTAIFAGIPYLLSRRHRPLDDVAHLLLSPLDKGGIDPAGAPFRSDAPFVVPPPQIREAG